MSLGMSGSGVEGVEMVIGVGAAVREGLAGAGARFLVRSISTHAGQAATFHLLSISQSSRTATRRTRLAGCTFVHTRTLVHPSVEQSRLTPRFVFLVIAVFGQFATCSDM
jgi:hypothetical protein